MVTICLRLCIIFPVILSAASAEKGVSTTTCDDHAAKPNHHNGLLTARWLVNSLNWGVLSTISTRNGNNSTLPVPFGNVFSIADGIPCSSGDGGSTGIPYFYATPLDQTMLDVAQNPTVSLTLSEAELAEGGTSSSWCVRNDGSDPENPPCARLVLTGTFVKVENDTVEHSQAQKALFARHPTMKYWPSGHGFFVGKIVITDLWLLGWFGGAAVLDVNEYKKLDYDTYLQKYIAGNDEDSAMGHPGEKIRGDSGGNGSGKEGSKNRHHHHKQQRQTSWKRLITAVTNTQLSKWKRITATTEYGAMVVLTPWKMFF